MSESKRLELSGIPWNQIRGFRNRIVHAYDQIDLDVVWKIVSTELPPLVHQLERILDHPKAPGS